MKPPADSHTTQGSKAIPNISEGNPISDASKSPQKLNGTAQFGLDCARHRHALCLVARPSVAASLEFRRLRATEDQGVRPLSKFLREWLVYRGTFWSAKLGRDKLKIPGMNALNEKLSTLSNARDCSKQFALPGNRLAGENSDAGCRLAAAGINHHRRDDVPSLVHAMLEPMNLFVVGPAR